MIVEIGFKIPWLQRAKYGFRATDFHEMFAHYIFVGIPFNKFYPNRTKNVENSGKMSPLVKYNLYRTDQ